MEAGEPQQRLEMSPEGLVTIVECLAWTLLCGRLESAAIQIESYIVLLLCQLIFTVSLNVITRGIKFRETAG